MVEQVLIAAIVILVVTTVVGLLRENEDHRWANDKEFWSEIEEDLDD